MKHHIPIFFGLLLALGLALMFTAPVFADDAPPPEQPAAPEAAAPPAPEGGGESGGEAEAPVEALTSGAPDPLAIAGGDLGILGPPWAYYYVGTTLVERDQPQDLINNILETGILPSNRMIYLQQGTFNGFEIDGGAGSGILSQLKGLLGNGDYPNPVANFTGYNNEDASVINSGGVEVHHTTAGFLLQGLNVTGGNVYLHDNVGTLTIKSLDVGNGCETLVEDHNGAISVDSLTVSGAGGAILDNTDSASAGVTILNSAFRNNSNVGGDAMGLAIYTRGLAKLSGIDAFQNQATGLHIEALKGIELYNAYSAENGGHGVEIISTAAAKVTVKDLQTHTNGDDGLHIETLGDILLTQIAASNNGQNNDGFGNFGFGINISTWPQTPGGRNLVGMDLGAWDNHDTGLDLKVSGSATLSGLFTSNN